MAAIICNHSLSGGLNNLNEHVHDLTRSYPLHWSGDLRSSLSCCHGTQRCFGKTRIRKLEVKRCSRRRWILTKSLEDDSSTTHKEENDDDISGATLIWRAVKLPIYAVAVVPLTVSLLLQWSSVDTNLRITFMLLNLGTSSTSSFWLRDSLLLKWTQKKL